MENIIQENTTTIETPLLPAKEPEQQVKAPAYTRQQVSFTMAGLLLALLFASLDQNIVGTAMPRIIGEFHGFDYYTWVATSYMLTTTIMIPIWGKLSDLLGRKVIFLTCLGIFLIGSALCGMAQSIDQLILFRAFQGLGAGGIMPVAMTAFADLLPPRERAKWQGIIMSFFGVSSILGPIIGGLITDNLTWRWAFYVNLPFGLLAMIFLALLMPALRHSETGPRIDFLGIALLITGLVPVLLGFSWAGTLFPWLSWQILSMLGGGAILLIMLGFYETALERRGGEPVISPSLLSHRAFNISTLCLTITFMGMIANIAFLPLYAQGVLHISATNSGFLLTPMMLSLIASSVIGGQIVSRTGKYKLLAIFGMALVVCGGALLLRLDLHSSYIDMIIPMILTGIGIGFGFSIYNLIIMNALPAQQRGQAVANMDFFQEMAGPIILSVLGPVLASQYAPAYRANLSAMVKQFIPAPLLNMFDKPDVLLNPTAMQGLTTHFAAFGQNGHALLDQLLTAVLIGLTQSIHTVSIIGFGILLIGLVTVFFLPKVKIETTEEHE